VQDLSNGTSLSGWVSPLAQAHNTTAGSAVPGVQCWLRVGNPESGQEFAVKESATVEIADDGEIAFSAAGEAQVVAARVLKLEEALASD
jgi:hypothetical protein